jgi:hypothetical protein
LASIVWAAQAAALQSIASQDQDPSAELKTVGKQPH